MCSSKHSTKYSHIRVERNSRETIRENLTVRTHYPIAHQPSLAARPRTYFLQTGSYDVSIHPRHLSVLPTVVFHPCVRHDIQTTAAVFYLTSSGRSVRSSLYTVGKRAFPVSCATVWNDLPLHVASAPSFAVFRQLLKNLLFSRSY